MIDTLGWILCGVGLSGLVTVLVGYPLIAWAVGALRGASRRPGGRQASPPSDSCPRAVVSVIVAMRNAEALLERKLDSLKGLNDAGAELEIVLASDGSTDSTALKMRSAAAAWPAITPIVLEAHEGKHVALNAAVAASKGSILVFTDVDAVLEPDAVRWLVEALIDPAIGGVCGRRMIGELDTFVGAAQTDYVALDSGLKGLESAHGSITSNDGKLFAIRRELFEPVPPGVTDDLFANMSVVRQGARFVYDGRARAWIRSPSRSTKHELSRRRRIVCRSLRGISSQRAVLNPAKTGLYAIGLLINKVGRRLMPIFLLASLLGIGLLALHNRWALALLIIALLGITVALAQPKISKLPLPKAATKALALGHYFVIGSIGTLLGLVDFATNRQVTRWDPIKAD